MLSLVAMAVIASASAVIYWSAPLSKGWREHAPEPPDRGVRETAELNAWLASDRRAAPAHLVPLRPSTRRQTLLWRIWVAVVWFVAILAVTGAVVNMISPQY